MQIITSSELQSQIGKIMKLVQREPVTINSHGTPVAVLLSYDEFEKMRSEKIQDFTQFCEDVSLKAAAKGMNEKVLKELLEDE